MRTKCRRAQVYENWVRTKYSGFTEVKHHCRAKFAFSTKVTFWSLHYVQFRINLLVKTVWPNSFAKVVKNAIKVAHLPWFWVFCTKLYRKLTISQTMFFVPSRESTQILIWHNCSSLPYFQNWARYVWYSISYPFFIDFCPLDFINWSC